MRQIFRPLRRRRENKKIRRILMRQIFPLLRRRREYQKCWRKFSLCFVFSFPPSSWPWRDMQITSFRRDTQTYTFTSTSFKRDTQTYTFDVKRLRLRLSKGTRRRIYVYVYVFQKGHADVYIWRELFFSKLTILVRYDITVWARRARAYIMSMVYTHTCVLSGRMRFASCYICILVWGPCVPCHSE